MKKPESLNFVFTVALIALIAVSTPGCVQIRGVGVDPVTHATNTFSGNFFFAKSAVEKLEIFRQTKTTSAMLTAKNASESGDVEMVKALADAFGQVVATSAKTAVKP